MSENYRSRLRKEMIYAGASAAKADYEMYATIHIIESLQQQQEELRQVKDPEANKGVIGMIGRILDELETQKRIFILQRDNHLDKYLEYHEQYHQERRDHTAA